MLAAAMKDSRWGRGRGRSQTRSSSVFSPFLDDDDHGSQEQDQDQQATHAGGQDQPHVLGVLGHLQGTLGVLAGGWKTPRFSQDSVILASTSPTRFPAKLAAARRLTGGVEGVTAATGRA